MAGICLESEHACMICVNGMITDLRASLEAFAARVDNDRESLFCAGCSLMLGVSGLRLGMLGWPGWLK